MSATVLRSGLATALGKSLKPGNAASRLASTSVCPSFCHSRPSKLISLAKTYSASPLTRVTTLPNRIRVATETTPGHFQALGVYIDAGSRFESKETSGVSHLMDRMAFKVSQHVQSPLINHSRSSINDSSPLRTTRRPPCPTSSTLSAQTFSAHRPAKQ